MRRDLTARALSLDKIPPAGGTPFAPAGTMFRVCGCPIPSSRPLGTKGVDLQKVNLSPSLSKSHLPGASTRQKRLSDHFLFSIFYFPVFTHRALAPGQKDSGALVPHFLFSIFRCSLTGR